MSLISIEAVNGEEYKLTPQIFNQLQELSDEFYGWSSEEVIQCWCLLRSAVYSRSRRSSAVGTMKLYKSFLLELSNRFLVDSILEVIADGRSCIGTPDGLFELVMTELG